MLISFLAFMLFMALILAEWEIQIEGKDGWVAKSPGWRIEKGWLMKLSGGRPVTGYHIYMTVFLIALVHLPPFLFDPDMETRKSAAGILCGDGIVGGFPVVCFKSLFRSEKVP